MTVLEYPQMKILETKRCILRAAKMSDATDLFECYKEEKVVKYLPFKKHNSIKDTKNFIRTYFIDHYKKGEIGHFVIVYKKDNKVIGNVGFNNIKRSDVSGEIGICINPLYWGENLSEELAKEILRFGFNDLKLEKVTATTFEDNKYSRKSLEALGFKYLGLSKKRDKTTIKTKTYMCHKYETYNYISR